MATSTTTSICTGTSNARCEIHGQKINGDGMCRVGRAQKRDGQMCAFCRETLVTSGQGWRINPAVASVLAEKPELMCYARPVPNARICDPCEAVLSAEGGGSVIIHQEPTRMLVRAGKIVPVTPTATVLAVIYAIQERRHVLANERSGEPRRENGRVLTRCTISAVSTEVCQCGGWHQLDNMRAFEVCGPRNTAFIGPQCAVEALENGIKLIPGSAKNVLEEILGQQVTTTYEERRRPAKPATVVGVCQAIAGGRHVRFAPRDGEGGVWRNGCACAVNGAPCCGGGLTPTAQMWAITRRSAHGDQQIFTICQEAAGLAEAAGIAVVSADEAFRSLIGPSRTGGGGQDLRRQFSFDTVASGVGERTRAHPGKPGGTRGPAPCGAKKAGRKCNKQK